MKVSAINPSNNSYYSTARSYVAAFFLACALYTVSTASNASEHVVSNTYATSQTKALLSAESSAVSSAEDQKPWTEGRWESVTKAAQDAFDNKTWAESIMLGESALKGCQQLYSARDRRCIRLMKNNSMAYFRAERLAQNAEKIEVAYHLASSELGPNHFTTLRTREVFHQLLLDQARYTDAIPVHIKLIEIEQRMGNDEFKILDGLIQLYAMYKVEGVVEQEIPTLLKMTELTEALLGEESDQLTRTVTVLAKTYCEQKHYHDFYEVRDAYQLKEKCKLPIRSRLARLFSRR